MSNPAYAESLPQERRTDSCFRRLITQIKMVVFWWSYYWCAHLLFSHTFTASKQRNLCASIGGPVRSPAREESVTTITTALENWVVASRAWAISLNNEGIFAQFAIEVPRSMR